MKAAVPNSHAERPPSAEARVSVGAYFRGERFFFGPSGTRELDPRRFPDIVPLVFRPTSARYTPTTAKDNYVLYL